MGVECGHQTGPLLPGTGDGGFGMVTDASTSFSRIVRRFAEMQHPGSGSTLA
jgi:hypothetical protein